MTGIIVLILALGSVGVLAQSSPGVMGRLSWCNSNTLCMCETATNTEVQCFEEEEILHLVGVNGWTLSRLRETEWSVETKVYWCNDLCLCNIQSDKQFRCTEPGDLTQFIINNIGNTYYLPLEGESDIKQETERSVDQEEDPALAQEAAQRKKADRKRNKKNRRKNKKTKNMNRPEDSIQEPESEPEPQPEPEADVHTTTTSTPTSEPFPSDYYYVSGLHEVEEFDASEDPEPLPKQEAVAASPAVTALQPPTRQLVPHSTPESYTPRAAARDLEGLSPRVQPVVEVPKEKKTMASMVSQDLNDLDTTVRNIKNDVMLNQRILLVTVAIAGVAMLGVLILAILGCTTRRHNQAANTKKKDSVKDGNHTPKVMDEAW